MDALIRVYAAEEDKLVTAFDAHTHAAGGFMAPGGGGPVTGVSGTPATSITAVQIRADKLESE